jgi:acetyl esterase/lipase
MTRQRVVVAPAASCLRTRIAWGGIEADVYRPADAPLAARLPAVVFVTGYPDPGFRARMGVLQKDMAGYVSWAELVAGAGLAAVTYACARPDDVHALFAHLEAEGSALGIDPARLGIWACSGNGPNALGVLRRSHRPRGVRCAAIGYGFLMDVDGATTVADSALTWGFANPLRDCAIADLCRDVPLAIVRAGRDATPGLNESLDRFVAAARREGLSLECIDVPEAAHAFDLTDASEASRTAVLDVVRFLRTRLSPPPTQ